MGGLSWTEALVVGAMQGVAELFPVSSLGHSVLLPAVVGGTWAQDMDVSSPESPYLAFVVGLHVATAVALVIYFWRDWMRIVRGLATSIARREVRTADQRLGWLLVLATIPVGVAGLLLEHLFRTVFSRPEPTAAFLVLNGIVLIVGERLRARADVREVAVAGHGASPGPAGVDGQEPGEVVDGRLSRLPVGRAVLIGAAQIAALLPGISRSGSAMVTGLGQGLSRTDSARFSFLLATPVILAAGVLKLGDLAGPLGDGIRPQILVGSLLSGIGAYLSVRFLTRYFENRSLKPFGIYCIAVGVACLVWFAVR